MAKCTWVRCPMQHGYKVDECSNTDCPYRTEPVTNADRIRAMSDEELAVLLIGGCRGSKCNEQEQNEYGSVNCYQCRLKWLQQTEE